MEKESVKEKNRYIIFQRVRILNKSIINTIITRRINFFRMYPLFSCRDLRRNGTLIVKKNRCLEAVGR